MIHAQTLFTQLHSRPDESGPPFRFYFLFQIVNEKFYKLMQPVAKIFGKAKVKYERTGRSSESMQVNGLNQMIVPMTSALAIVDSATSTHAILVSTETLDHSDYPKLDFRIGDAALAPNIHMLTDLAADLAGSNVFTGSRMLQCAVLREAVD